MKSFGVTRRPTQQKNKSAWLDSEAAVLYAEAQVGDAIATKTMAHGVLAVLCFEGWLASLSYLGGDG
jgi:hypothetical protein